MFAQMQNSASDEGQKTYTFLPLTLLSIISLYCQRLKGLHFSLDVSEVAKELLPSKDEFIEQCFHPKKMAENQKQQLRNFWTLPGLHRVEKM